VAKAAVLEAGTQNPDGCWFRSENTFSGFVVNFYSNSILCNLDFKPNAALQGLYTPISTPALLPGKV